MTPCIRCNQRFNQEGSMNAHFFTICYDCRNTSPETIQDQNEFNRKYNTKGENIKFSEQNSIIGSILPFIF